MVKRKFSGMSFGGFIQGVTIYGKKYKTQFRRNRKEKDKYTVFTEINKFNTMLIILILFPLIDFFSVIMDKFLVPFIMSIRTPKVITNVGSNVGSNIVLPLWFWLLFPFIWIGLWYAIAYFLLFRGVKKWHGTEHKIINAAENNDLDNVKKYNPIHERCGGTLFPTIFVAIIIWSIVQSYLNINFGTLTFVTICIFINVKFLHKYDKIGVWVGKRVQKYLTISEPDDWQLNLGKIAMKNLLLAEEGKEFKKEIIVRKGDLL